MLVVSLCSIGPILVIKVIESIDLVSKYPFYLPFYQTCFPIEVVVLSFLFMHK